MITVISLIIEKKSKAKIKNVDFLIQFCLRSLSNAFDAIHSREISLKGNVYDFWLITIY